MSLKAAARATLLAFFIVALAGVLLRPLTPIDETRYIAVAWEMWLNHTYLVPTKNFEIYTHKPPLLFWTINLVWLFTGVSELAARLVGPLYALLAIWLTGRLAAKLWPQDEEIASRAIMVLAGLLLFAVMGTLTMFDAMLSVASLAGMLALINAIDTGRWRWWVALGAALAVGVLAKGPVILLHVAPAVIAAPWWARGRADLTWRAVLAGGGLALLSALGFVALWLLPAITIGGPDYRDAILWTQSAGRISSSFAHARGWWFFVALLPVLLFPWIFVPAIWKAALAARWQEPGLRLALVWGLSALVLFSLISGKQVHYLIPEMPAVALIFARLLHGQPSFRTIFAVIPVALVALVAIAGFLGLVDLGSSAPLLQPAQALLWLGLILLVLCALVIWLGGLRGSVTLTLGTVLLLNLFIGFTALRPTFDTAQVAKLIGPYEDAGIAYVGRPYNAEFNFAGRFTKPVSEIIDPAQLPAWIAAHPDGIIVARPQEVGTIWPPYMTLNFRNAPHALWRVADAPKSEPSS